MFKIILVIISAIFIISCGPKVSKSSRNTNPVLNNFVQEIQINQLDPIDVSNLYSYRYNPTQKLINSIIPLAFADNTHTLTIPDLTYNPEKWLNDGYSDTCSEIDYIQWINIFPFGSKKLVVGETYHFFAKALAANVAPHGADPAGGPISDFKNGLCDMGGPAITDNYDFTLTCDPVDAAVIVRETTKGDAIIRVDTADAECTLSYTAIARLNDEIGDNEPETVTSGVTANVNSDTFTTVANTNIDVPVISSIVFNGITVSDAPIEIDFDQISESTVDINANVTNYDDISWVASAGQRDNTGPDWTWIIQRQEAIMFLVNAYKNDVLVQKKFIVSSTVNE